MLLFFWWEEVDSNHRRRCQQIYSLLPLATRESSHAWSWWSESNQQPADYKSAALPLSHTSNYYCDAQLAEHDVYYNTSRGGCQ